MGNSRKEEKERFSSTRRKGGTKELKKTLWGEKVGITNRETSSPNFRAGGGGRGLRKKRYKYVIMDPGFEEKGEGFFFQETRKMTIRVEKCSMQKKSKQLGRGQMFL